MTYKFPINLVFHHLDSLTNAQAPRAEQKKHIGAEEEQPRRNLLPKEKSPSHALTRPRQASCQAPHKYNEATAREDLLQDR